MDHQPFETWILNEEDLSPTQAEDLNRHLNECEACKQRRTALAVATRHLRMAGMAVPQAGFSQRFQTQLAQRKMTQKKKVTRRLLAFLVGSMILALLAWGGFTLLTTSPAAILAAGIKAVTTFLLQLDTILKLMQSVRNTVPPILPITLWILFAGAAGLMSLLWAGTLWQLSKQGAQNR